ncbi:hypothetical protein BLNAU_3994 [Blattamonas nauphoetae]|uniref:Uncharacterized protein n=1 Tax=Blattamonas nauphoetae TaxID=2049346 RepID=A0ABQ9YB04_9EUKA|nr:hypothetical protein BLNAU_3994 [Blattamonas nauphoetae]
MTQLVLNMPAFLTIPSCLTFFEDDLSIYNFLLSVSHAQQECNEKRGDQRRMWKAVHRMLRMEGIEDVMEEKLQIDPNESSGHWIVDRSIRWNNLLGMNLPEHD